MTVRGSWRTARDTGAGRLAQPVELIGLQAHALIHHDADREKTLAASVHELALEHARDHADRRIRHLAVPASR